MHTPIKVVLADANEKYRALLEQEMQESEDFTVVGSTSSGTEAWEIIERELPQLVITDVVLPGMSGLTLLSHMASMETMPKIVLVSTVCHEEIIASSMKLGASYFIAKPCGIDALLSQARCIMFGSDGPTGGDADKVKVTQIEEELTEELKELGIPANVKGYMYLRDAIVMTAFNMSLIDAITKQLYLEIAKSHQTSPCCVERSIRHAIELAWERGSMDIQQKYFGCTVSGSRGKPTNSEFIAMFADRLNLHYHLNSSRSN